jgi:hypothetical protein
MRTRNGIDHDNFDPRVDSKQLLCPDVRNLERSIPKTENDAIWLARRSRGWYHARRVQKFG